ncbi:uncharacterized protein LOC142572651 [Dermacentor variabilis]|uniref:uncharacterized protein LOC142572651 n=1 Tax=Dermacentor variabilis TaxID=34621 RepID=UPI003F5BF803
MSSTSKAYNLPGAACALRDEGFFHDRRVLRAEAGRRNRRQTLLEARRHIDISCADEPQATGTAEEENSDDDATPLTHRMKRFKKQKQLLKVLAPKQKAPFRLPSREPSPLPALPDYASFRQRHLRYYDSIRHTFSSNASSVGTCVDRHANCKAAHASSKHPERPPWNDSTQVSFAPAGFQFQCQVPGSKRAATKAASKSENGKAAEVKSNTTKNATGVGTAAQQKLTPLQLPDFSFLFKPARFSLLFPAKKVNKTEEKTSAKRDTLASVGNTWSASQSVKLGGSMRRHLASKENMPGVEPQRSTNLNTTSKEKQANLSPVPADKENVVKSSYNLRRTKLSSANK